MLTLVLFKKELRSLFSSWIAYVVLIAFTMLNGVSFFLALKNFQILTKYSGTVESGVARQSWNVLNNLVQPVYNTVFVLLFVMVPAITMRMFSEERKQKTEELLLTSPIRVMEIVLAKYLAGIALITVMMVPVAILPLITINYGQPQPDWGPMLTGYFGLFIMGYSLAAIGVFASSLTENQIVAFIITVALEMILIIIARASVSLDVVHIGNMIINLGSVTSAFSISEHFQPMLEGIIRGSDLLYFFSLVIFWLWATRQSVESSRWG